MESIEDDEDGLRNIGPRNKSHVLELADGSDDDLPLRVSVSFSLQ